jgi:hypothetical protein
MRGGWIVNRETRHPIEFDHVNRAAIAALPAILARWLPRGRIVGREYVALNPTRSDERMGSFKVALSGPRAGAWADFATGDKGGDVISLAAYLTHSTQVEAARQLSVMLGIE